MEKKQDTYPFWKVVFELDESNPDDNSNWYDIEEILIIQQVILMKTCLMMLLEMTEHTIIIKITDTTSGTTSDQKFWKMDLEE